MTGKHHPPKHHIKYCSCQWNHVKSYWKTIWNSSSSIIKHKVIVGIECHRTSPISILLLSLSLSPSLPPSLHFYLGVIQRQVQFSLSFLLVSTYVHASANDVPNTHWDSAFLFGNSPPTSSPIKTSSFGQVVNLQTNSFSWFRVVL